MEIGWVQILRVGSEFAFLLGAVVSDHRIRKVSNRLILAGVLLATALAALEGAQTLWSAVAGGTTALVVGFFLWKLRVFRAGDAKLLWMTMQFAGWERWALHMIVILITGGICAVLILLYHGLFVRRMRRLGQYLYGMIMAGQYTLYEPEQEDTLRFPFAYAVLLGELAVCLIR